MRTLKRVWNAGRVVATVTWFGAVQALAMSDPVATTSVQNDIAAVPEPGAALLFAAGVGLVAFTVRRSRS
jgi:hypothetical protein